MADDDEARADHYEERESWAPERRERDLLARLRAMLADVIPRTPGIADHLGGVDPQGLTDRGALARLPVLRKDALRERQERNPPFGGFLPEGTVPPRLFVSPGPIREPQPVPPDPFGAARALYAAGIRPGQRIVNCFGYHGTPGGFILDEGARALGASVYPAGPGNTDATVAAMRAFAVTAYVGTPDFLGALLERAEGDGGGPLPIERALVSGGALLPAMREAYAARGIQTFQCLATADLGVIAYETATGGTVHPGMVLNEDRIVEIVRPGTGDPVAPGEVGEIVVTLLDPSWPLVRLATGDMTRALDDPSPCGRTNGRIAGWMGRADQRTKVRGMFVDPAQIAALRTRHPAIGRARLVVTRENGADAMELRVVGDVDETALAAALRDALGLRGTVTRVDALPNDGVVIEDARDYET